MIGNGTFPNPWSARALLAAGVVLGMFAGCATPGKRTAANPAQSAVTKIVCFYDQNPFRSFDRAGDRNVEGFQVTVVPWSSQAGKGITEDGVIRMKMYRLDPVTPEKTVRSLVREWTVDTAGRPVFTSSLFGDGYKLEFIWAKEDEILGRDVEFVASFETPDGRVIQGRTASFKVPAAKSG